jgi:hypothetical protein
MAGIAHCSALRRRSPPQVIADAGLFKKRTKQAEVDFIYYSLRQSKPIEEMLR